jgi:hypothetical protein
MFFAILVALIGQTREWGADCLECDGGALDHDCFICQGRCGARWQRSIDDSWFYGLACLSGNCNLPDEEQKILLKRLKGLT